MAESDDWHARLARELAMTGTAHAVLPAEAAALEIEFGRARSAVTFALELARAHRVPVSGNVSGDEIWIKLGDGRIRFLLNRREGYVAWVISQEDEARARWDGDKHALVDAGGAPVDLGRIARESIDGLVAAWRKAPTRSPPPPPYREEEPTKG
jgi:hypothetical protein